MARVKGAMMTRKHRNKVLGLAKGYWGNKSRHYMLTSAASRRRETSVSSGSPASARAARPTA